MRVGRKIATVLRHPGAFALAVIKQFRANQGVLLAGAVAYYTLLSLVPLLIVVLLALSHIVPEDRLLSMLREYLEFIVPGQSNALVQELRTFLAHREVMGVFLLLTMLFFSALAFTILENAMSVIFVHRVAIRRRHLLVSALMPYIFVLFLGLGLLIITVVSGLLQGMGTRHINFLGQLHSLDRLSTFLLYILGVRGGGAYLSDLSRNASGTIVPPSCAGRRSDSRSSLGGHAPHPGLVLDDHVANSGGLRFIDDSRGGFVERRIRCPGAAARSPGDCRV